MTILNRNARTGTVVPIRGRRASCDCCGTTFAPVRAEYRYCGQCYAWLRIGALTEATRRQFEMLRELDR